MDMLRKLVKVDVKELGERVLEIAGSTEDVDRMGDVIKSSGWKLSPFKKNPVFMWGHDYSQPPIGRALKVWVDKETKRLMFQIEFADAETYAFADTIYKLYKGGFLHATSVGFIPLDWEGKDKEDEDGGLHMFGSKVYTKQELLELSAVPVPANANALVEARDSGLITVKEFEAVQQTPIVTIDKPDPLSIKLDAEIVAMADEPDPAAEVEPEPLPEKRVFTQELLRDEIDYVHQGIFEAGMSKETQAAALDMANDIIQRSLGNDIPIEILTKVGAVLNAKNKGRLTQIQELAQSVLDSAATPDEADESDKQLEPPAPDPAVARRQRALDVAEVAQEVIARLKGKRIY